MRILRSTSVWRTVAALLLVLASFVFLSEAVAKSRTRATSNGSVSKVSPAAGIGIVPAAVPASGTVDTTNQSLTYTDGPTAPNPTGVLGVPNCTAPNSCSDFVLTVNAAALAATKQLTWSVQWSPANVDLDIYILDANRKL